MTASVEQPTKELVRTVEEIRTLDKTSLAAMKWLITGNGDAFDHLVAICFVAKGNLFLVNGIDTSFWATRHWIEEFLLEFLRPYRSATLDELQQAAQNGAFRYVGRTCRLRMIDEIRKRMAQKRFIHPQALLQFPLADENGQEVRLAEIIAQDPTNSCHSSLGKPASPEELDFALLFLRNRAEFEALLGPRLLRALMAECWAFLNGTTEKGEVTRIVAERLGVKDRQARRYRAKVHRLLADARRARHPAADELFRLLAGSSASSAFLSAVRNEKWMDPQK